MSFQTGHALVLGVGEYQFMSEYNVPVAMRDADAVAGVLQNPKYCAYPAAQVQKLTGAGATRSAVITALDTLATQLKEEDTLFLFFVGHGLRSTDGNYYLTTADSQLQGKQIIPGTGISESDLIGRLRKIRARRMLLVINSCYSGKLSAHFGADETLENEGPPQKLTEALLSTGEGRITITACRPEQKSWIAPGELSIFSKALVNGLKGEAPNNNGYISAFALYEYVYQESKDAADEHFGETQEPELTVIKGVGPFPVALYSGAAAPGSFDASAPVPANTAARSISIEKSQRIYQQYQASLTGSGAIAQGNNAKAVGEGGILVDGNLNGNITIGNNNRINNK